MGTLTAGIKEIFSSAKTTGSNVMLCGNDGTPDGHITMANLANVLGVPQLLASQDPNNLPVFSLCYCINEQNAPNNYTMVFTLGGKSSGDMAQLGISTYHIYSRFRSLGEWTSWTEY